MKTSLMVAFSVKLQNLNLRAAILPNTLKEETASENDKKIRNQDP